MTPRDADDRRPLPVPDPVSRPFWDSLRQHAMRLQQCQDCRRFVYYPRPHCPHCHGDRLVWTPVSGRGVVHAFTIPYRHPDPAFGGRAPYVVALVELEEGARVLGNLVGVDASPSAVRVGMAVEVVYEDRAEEVTVAGFRPAGGGGGGGGGGRGVGVGVEKTFNTDFTGVKHRPGRLEGMDSRLSRLALAAPLALAGALACGGLPALAQSAPSAPNGCVSLQLANPHPGDVLSPGSLEVDGLAANPAAGQGGVDRVEFFLDSRDQGGVDLGGWTAGGTSAPFGPNSFRAVITLPSVAGGHDLVAYARSATNGQETVVSVPVIVGEDAATAGEDTASLTETTTFNGSCAAPSAAPAATSQAPAPAPAQGTPSASAPAAPATAQSGPVLTVANPSPGDALQQGTGYSLQGVAYDPAAQQGAGVDRVSIFLDSRDAGGVDLGDVTLGGGANGRGWAATITLPARGGGPRSLFFYAHSSVTGRETVVEVPVTLNP